MKKNKVAVIDLFCGIGGLSYGFVMENFNVIAGYDNDPSCKYIYETNNKPAKFIEADITDYSSEEIAKLYPKDSIKILVGCAPCQPFSKYTMRYRKDGCVSDNKRNLLNSFADKVEKIKPDIICMENVPELEKEKIFRDFKEKLEGMKYFVSYSIVYCPDYGVPQIRKRLILLASKLGDISLISKTHSSENYITVRDTIKNLKPVRHGEYDKSDHLHMARRLSDINLKRIKQTKEGGGWKDWTQDLVLECFKKPSGKGYTNVYGRMSWDKPAPTMTTQCTILGCGRFGHPEQDRAITLREAALFQTFPLNYKFYESTDKLRHSVICRQIGNAVPPKLGQVIAKSIKKHLKEYGLWQK
jgi:DNA (cytosine-5)-methyltransferase 1